MNISDTVKNMADYDVIFILVIPTGGGLSQWQFLPSWNRMIFRAKHLRNHLDSFLND